MKFIVIQTIILFFVVTIMLYLLNVTNFIPITDEGSINVLTVFVFFTALILVIQSLVSIIIYLFQKFMLYGKKEFPPSSIALKWGIGVAIVMTTIIVFNIYHLINLQFGLIIAFVIFVVFLLFG